MPRPPQSASALQEDEGVEQEEDEEEDGEEAGSPGCDAGSTGGGFMDLLLHTGSSTAAARAAAAAARAAAAVATGTAGSSPAPEDSLVLAGGSSSAAAAAVQLGSAPPQCRGGQGLPLAARLGLAEQQGPRRPTRKTRQRSPSPPPRLARASSGLPHRPLPMQLAQQAASQQQAQQQRQPQQQGQSPTAQLPAQLGSVPASPLVASAMHGGSDGGARLRALRNACCRLFDGSEAALLAMRRAYVSGAGHLCHCLVAPAGCAWVAEQCLACMQPGPACNECWPFRPLACRAYHPCLPTVQRYRAAARSFA